MSYWTKLCKLAPRFRGPTVFALLLKSVGAVGSFVITFVIARLYGASASGEYALAVQTALTASTFALLGLDQITVRTAAGDLREHRPDLARAAILQAARTVAATSIIGAGILLVLAPWSAVIGTRWQVIALAGLALLNLPLLRIAVSGLRAAGRIVHSQLIDGPVQSGALALMILGTTITGVRLRSESILLLYVASLTISCAFGWAMLARATRDWPRGYRNRHASPGTVGWGVMLTVGTHMLTGWILLAQVGAHSGLAEVGAFRVALQIVTMITMIITTVESIVNPRYAGDFRMGQFAIARRRHRQATLMLVAAAGPPVAIGLIFPQQLLALFGPEFPVATNALRILVLGQAVNILTGPIGGMLLMAGRERISLLLAVISLLLAASLTAWLTPLISVAGAATGYTAALIFRNVAAYIIVFRWLPKESSSTAGSDQ
jgi:O-antigen/teichoic acid export membrane protein